MEQHPNVSLYSAQVVYLGEKLEELRDDIKEMKGDIKVMIGKDSGQDQELAVLKDRVNMLIKVIGGCGLLIGGLVVESVVSLT